MPTVTDQFEPNRDGFESRKSVPHREHIEFRSNLLSTNILKELGKKISQKRVDKELSQEQLAKAAKIHQGHVSKIENGDCNPTWKVVVHLCDALETSLPEVMVEMYAETLVDNSAVEAFEFLGGQIQLMVRRDDARNKKKQENSDVVPTTKLNGNG